jgi:predicted RNase H-like HicB family nuclease
LTAETDSTTLLGLTGLCYRAGTVILMEQQNMIAGKAYTVSDGEMVLSLEPAEEGGYVVTSPLDPELVTEAGSLDEAFANARDAAEALNQSRSKLARQLADAESSP